MTLQLLEQAVVAVDAYLEANMAAKVADLRTRYSDADLPDIKKWYLGNFPHVTPEHPSVVVHGSSWQPKMQKSQVVHVSNSLNLVVFYGSDDPELRFRRLNRYALGLIELCHDGQASMGYVFYIGTPVMLTESMKPPDFIQGITVPVLMEQEETF